MESVIRRAREAEVDALVSLRAQMFDDLGMASPDTAWRDNCADWFRRSVQSPDVFLLVAESNRSLKACGMAELRHGAPGPACPSGRTVHISNVCTLPAFRGQGHGRRMMAALLEWAREVADRAELHASDDGQALYRHLGFTEVTNPAMRMSFL